MSSNPGVTSSVASEDHMATIPDTEEGAVGGVSASNSNSGARKVITLFGGFSRIEHPQYRGPDSIEKGKRIMDHIANIREVIERTRLVKKSMWKRDIPSSICSKSFIFGNIAMMIGSWYIVGEEEEVKLFTVFLS